MTETLAVKVARAMRRARAAKASGAHGDGGRDGDASSPDDDDIAGATAALDACFDEIWSDGYLIGAKYGASGMSAELLRAVAKEQLLRRAHASDDDAQPGAGLPVENPVARAEAALRHLAEQSKNRRS